MLFIGVYSCLLVVHYLMMVLGLFVVQFVCFLSFCLHLRHSFSCSSLGWGLPHKGTCSGVGHLTVTTSMIATFVSILEKAKDTMFQEDVPMGVL